MLVKTIFAGAGGQGVLSMAYCLAYAAMEEDRHVTYMPAYGAEVRGGTANCTIVISNEEIASPIASEPDHLVILNNPSLLRFQNMGRPGGTYLINTTLVNHKLTRRDVDAYEIPAGRIADDNGGVRNTNMVLLGAFLAVTKLVSLRTMNDCIEAIFATKNKKIIDINQQALKAGYDYITTNYGAAKKKVASSK